MQQQKVNVGVTSVAGYGATVVGLIATALVALLGVDQEEASLVAASAFTVASFAITQVGRYSQAAKMAAPAPRSSPAPGTMYSGALAQSAIASTSAVRYEPPGSRVLTDPVAEPEPLPPELMSEEPADPTALPPDQGDSEAGSG